MKKVLEAELLSIAHRILQMKNKEDVNNLYQEAKQLYEKLLILKFHEDNFNLIQPNIETAEIEHKLENAFQAGSVERSQMPVDLIDEEYPLVVEIEVEDLKKHQEFADPQQNTEVLEEKLVQDQAIKIEETVEELVEPQINLSYDEATTTNPYREEEEKSEVVHYLESEDWTEEDLEEEQAIENAVVSEKPYAVEPELTEELEEVLNQHLINREGIVEDAADTVVETTLEDSFFGIEYQDVDFIRVEEIDKEQELVNQLVFEPVSKHLNFEGELPVSEIYHSHVEEESKTERSRSLNDAFSQHISVSLNDRIAFEKYLFSGSAEDFNRVLSQLNTFNSLDQAIAFIEDLVKPDYDYWTGKEEYEGRLMDLIEKRFA